MSSTMMKRSPLFLALLGLAACAGTETGSPRAQLNTEVGCYVDTDQTACRRNHDLAGGYPITALDE